MTTVTAIVCIVASTLLGWRLVACWDDSTLLVRALTALLGASVFLAAVAAAVAMYAAGGSTVAQTVLLLVLAHGVGCITVAALWPRLQYRFTIPTYRNLQRR